MWMMPSCLPWGLKISTPAGGQRIKAAFAIDDETICASYDSWEIIRTFTSAFVNSEIPAIAQNPIGIDIERQHVQAVGVVQKQRLLIAAQRNPVRSLDPVGNFDRFAARRDVVHSGRKAWRQRLTRQSFLYGFGLGSV